MRAEHVGMFRAGITDRVELREGGGQRPAAWEEGRAWRLGVRWHGGTASETGLGDLRCLGAELGASSSPTADGTKDWGSLAPRTAMRTRTGVSSSGLGEGWRQQGAHKPP